MGYWNIKTRNCQNCQLSGIVNQFHLKSRYIMRYDISKASAPKMPKLGKGTECIKILLSQVSNDIREPLVPMLFPILGAYISGAEFQYPDLTWKETCGMMANLVAESGGTKGQLSYLVEAICRDFRQHDEAELKKLVEWQKQVKTRTHAECSRTHAGVLANSCRSNGEHMQLRFRAVHKRGQTTIIYAISCYLPYNHITIANCIIRIKGMPNWNFLCMVLWCHTLMPSQAPMLPPMTAKPKSVASEMRHLERLAFHLSMPYMKKVTTFMATR